MKYEKKTNQPKPLQPGYVSRVQEPYPHSLVILEGQVNKPVVLYQVSLD